MWLSSIEIRRQEGGERPPVVPWSIGAMSTDARAVGSHIFTEMSL